MNIPEEAILTHDKCPNKCGQVLFTWYEDGAPDGTQVWYCPACEERSEQ